MRKLMISCFDYSCTMAEPWANAGYKCYCVDVKHPRGESMFGNIVKVGADIRRWTPPRGDVAFASFFPPCTDLAISGSRWFKDKGLYKLSEAIELFARSVEIAESLDCPYIIENPVSTISTYWRKPDHKFDPCDYGDPWTKKTCLWVGGGFVMPPKSRVEPTEGSKILMMPDSKGRQERRCATPPGFAAACFSANAGVQIEQLA